MKRLLIIAATACAFTGISMAAPVYYFTRLSGANEFPANASAGTGTAEVLFDDGANTMRVIVRFEGLTAANTAAHIHCCTANAFDITQTAGVATPTPTFPGFPAGTAGFYDQTFDLTLASSYRAGFITANGGSPAGAEAALGAGLLAGKAYLNVHSSVYPGGEIRGFLTLAPEPGTWVLMSSALAGLAFLRRRR